MTQRVGFDFVDHRVMAAVQRVASNDPNPADPFRGLYISDETALQLTRGESASGADDRLAAVTAALGLDLLDAAVLATCAAPELNPRFGRLFAYLQDDVTRKLPSARLIGHLLEGEGVTRRRRDELLRRRPPAAAARRGQAARRRADAAGRAAPEGRRPARRAPARRAAGRAADADAAAARAAPGARPGPPRPRRRGRRDALAPSDLPVVLCGPDAEALLAKAYGRPLVVAHVRDMEQRDVMADAALISALEGRPIVFEGLEEPRPRRARAAAARARRAPRARGDRRADARRHARARRRTVLLVEAPPPTYAERQQAWTDLTGVEDTRDVAAKFRLSMGQIVEAGRGRAARRGARGEDRPTHADLDLGSRQASSSRLGELASRLPPGYRWEDLVVPERQLELLRRSPPTCATATACSPTGATSAPSRARRG